MTLTQANREKTKVKLSAADPGPNDMVEKLPQQLQDLIAPLDDAASQGPPSRYHHPRAGDGTRRDRQSAGAAAQSPQGGVRALVFRFEPFSERKPKPTPHQVRAGFVRKYFGAGSLAASALSRARRPSTRESSGLADPVFHFAGAVGRVHARELECVAARRRRSRAVDADHERHRRRHRPCDDGVRRPAVGGLRGLCRRLGSHSSRLQRAVGADVSQRRSRRDLSGGARLFAGAGRARRQPVRRRMDER